MGLYIEDLLNDDRYCVEILLPPKYTAGKGKEGGSRRIRGIWLAEDYVISGANTFSKGELIQGFDNAIAGAFKQTQEIIRQTRIDGNSVVQRNFKTGFGGVKTWSDSEDFVLNLKLLFITLEDNKQPKDKVSGTDNAQLPCMELLSMVYPTINTTAGLSILFDVHAPSGYSPPPFVNASKVMNPKLEAKTMTGVSQVKVGDFLFFRNCLITGVDVNLSAQLTKNKIPLYAEVGIKCEFHRDMYFSDIELMFDRSIKNEELANIIASNNLIDLNLTNKFVKGADNLLQATKEFGAGIINGLDKDVNQLINSPRQ